MAHKYAIRVHELSDDMRGRLGDFCERTGGGYYCVRETDAERPHFQGIIWCDVNDKAMRARLKKAFPECVGNKGYSLTAVKDEDKYVRYLSKGTTKDTTPDVVCWSGVHLGTEVFQRWHDEYWAHPSKVAKDGKRETKQGIVDAVCEWYDMQEFEGTEMDIRTEVAAYLCDEFSKVGKMLNVFQLRGYVNSVMYRKHRPSRQNIIFEIVNKY